MGCADRACDARVSIARRVSPAVPTSLFGLLGFPVAGNPTQEMVEAAFAGAELDFRYVSLEVRPDALREAVLGVRALGFGGVHITLPHKVAVVPLLDEITSTARISGAVNCIKRVGDSLLGDNTDGRGFVASLSPLVDPRGCVAVVFGAGGAARAIVAELALAGVARVIVVNRTLERAEDVARSVAAGTGVPCDAAELTEPFLVPASARIVVQATTVGMGGSGRRLPLDWSESRPDAIAADVVIRRDRTVFLRDADEQGLHTLDGIGMLVEQAVIGFRWWTGVEPNIVAMRSALDRALAPSGRA
jgi:shikimate dehydrogenase